MAVLLYFRARYSTAVTMTWCNLPVTTQDDSLASMSMIIGDPEESPTPSTSIRVGVTRVRFGMTPTCEIAKL